MDGQPVITELHLKAVRETAMRSIGLAYYFTDSQAAHDLMRVAMDAYELILLQFLAERGVAAGGDLWETPMPAGKAGPSGAASQ